jgi:enolase
LRELDGSPEKMYLGANTLYAVSGAVAKAQAYVEEIELFELFAHLVDLESVTIPFPLFNALSGGKHAPFTGLAFQEFLVIPVGMSSYRACLESAVTFFHYLAYVLNEHASAYTISEEGGFAAIVADEQAALDLLVMTAQYASQENNVQYVFALDVAATHLYDAEKKVYTWNGHTKTTQEMIGWYEQLIAKYPLYSIEDGLHEGDREGWQEMSMRIGDQVRLVGDDLCVTQTPRIATALNQHLIDTVIIKPNQVGTLTEALEAIKLARQHEAACMVSHRCADTPDTLIADLAVGTSASHIKAGGLFRSERLEKYLQLVRIEDFLMFSLLN